MIEHPTASTPEGSAVTPPDLPPIDPDLRRRLTDDRFMGQMGGKSMVSG
jgi:hypothetical protein